MRFGALGAALLMSVLHTSSASAAITLLEKDEWQINMEGFIELDNILDSHRGLKESPGNAPVPLPSDAAGRNGQWQSSIRNSRLAFSVFPPVHNGWKSKGHLEFDLLGYDPDPSTVAPKDTESGYYSNPTMRIRHAYFNLEKDGWNFLAGQYWSFFGWQPSYVMTTDSVAPVPGVLYQRLAQATAIKTMMLGETSKLQAGLSLSRPTQRDASRPNLDVGTRYSWLGRTAGFASASGEAKLEPASIALSGTFRSFTTPKEPTGLLGHDRHEASAFAIDAALPLLAANEGDKSPSNTLLLMAEFSMGTGYGDQFPGWSGSPQLPNETGLFQEGKTNLDPGLGGFDGNGNFRLLQLQTWNAQLQYHLGSDWHTFVTAGFGQLQANRLGDLVLTGQRNAATDPLAKHKYYDAASVYFLNVFHDLTKQVRLGVEYAHFATHHLTSKDEALNDRYQLTGYFRF